MRPASDAEKKRLADTFVRLCEIESPSGGEAEMAKAVRGELEGIGLRVVEDDTAAEAGAACGNLIASLPAADGESSPRAMMLGAHLDTVSVSGPIEVELADGTFTSRGDTILGADNKAAVAVLLVLAHRCVSERPPVTCELVFTTSEENGLRGAKALDVGRLEAEFGYVLDHATPIGELMLAAPTYYRVTADFTGRAAHSGIRPEDGRSAIGAAVRAIEAMRLGRLDEETTANVGKIRGGTATNIVAEHCRVEAEVRSLDDAKATSSVQEMVDALTWAAGSTETDVDTTVEEQFRSYRIPQSDASVVAAAGALEDCGVEPVYTATGGGSDANMFEAKGLRCVNLANGTEANHTPDERVSVAALEQMLDVTLALLGRAAQV